MGSDTHNPIDAAPAWSVVIPAYNRPQRLQACLDALVKLQAPPGGFEVLVVDDGSSPALAPQIAPPAGLDLRVIRQDNAGPASARNRGAAEARGGWLAFTDDDCRPHAQWLCRLEQSVDGQEQSIVGGHTLNALPGCATASASQLLIDFLHDYFNTRTGGPTFFPSNNFCISRRAYEALKGFDVGFPLAAAEDRDFCDRAVGAGLRLIYQPEAIIDHAHQMNLRGFWRQHFNYGRGAFAFHTIRAQRNAGKIKREPLRFYMGLVCYPLRSGVSLKNLWLSVLMALSQVANIAGFFHERRRSTRKK